MRRYIIFLFLAILISCSGLFLTSAVDPYASRIRPFTSIPTACAENQIGYSMTLHNLYICTNGGYQLLLISGSVAPKDATYITETANSTLTNEFALGSLATGILKNTTTTGVPSIAVAGTDYQVPITAGDVTTSGATSTIGALKVLDAMINSLAWSKITSTPTTIAGYGITDFNSLGDARWLKLAGGTLTGNLLFTDNTLDIGASGATRPRTGYFGTSLISPLFNGLAITNNGTNTLNIAAGKTLNISNILTFTGTDSSSIAFGAGGTVVYTNISTLSSLASIGTITTGVWNGTIITGTYGGTGVNNGSSTITLGNNFVTSGNFSLTLTQTGTTNVTLPTSGTLLTTTGAGTGLSGIPYSLTGTANQVVLSAATGNITFSLPQSIDTAATVQFGKIGIAAANVVSGTIIASAHTQSNTNLVIRAAADVSAAAGPVLDAVTDGSGARIQNNIWGNPIVLGGGVVNMPGLGTSSAATTGTLCWTTGTGLVNVDTTTTCLLSAGKYKEQELPLDIGLNAVMQLKPVSYFLKKEYDPTNIGNQVGFFAEDVAKVDKRLVSLEDDGSPHAVRYQQLTAVLTKAIQEQQVEIQEQHGEIKVLQKEVEKLKKHNHGR